MLPRNVQKDPETSLAWEIKDEVLRRGRVYYSKLAGGRATFIAPRMIEHFHAIWGVRRSQEKARLSADARAILRVLRREWEMTTAVLRKDARIRDRAIFTRALQELQAAMLVVPSAAVYEGKFTYLYTLAIGRFPTELSRRGDRDVALREIARCFLAGAGMTLRGELARVTGLSRAEAGRGNRALVAEGYATMVATGVYRMASLTS